MTTRSAEARLNIWLILACVPACLLSLSAGKVFIPLDHWFSGGLQSIILFELRVPRTLLALLIGGGLGLGGAVMQGFLRNPLADPGLFGVSSSAACGAVLAIFLGLSPILFALPIFALSGAALGMILLTALAGRTGGLVAFTLAGLILASLSGAATALIISLAPSPFLTAEIVTWLMGALSDRSWNDVLVAAPFVVLGCGLLLMRARDLDALTLGELTARSMGVDMGRLQLRIVLGIGLIVGGSVAAAGVIGFVGLMAPHAIRHFVKNQPSHTLIPSFLAGALLVVIADSCVRLSPQIVELRLGVAMSLLGAPFFLWILARMRRGQGW